MEEAQATARAPQSSRRCDLSTVINETLSLKQYIEKLREEGRKAYGVRTQNSTYVLATEPGEGIHPFFLEKVSDNQGLAIAPRQRVKLDEWFIAYNHRVGGIALEAKGEEIPGGWFDSSIIKELVGFDLTAS